MGAQTGILNEIPSRLSRFTLYFEDITPHSPKMLNLMLRAGKALKQKTLLKAKTVLKSRVGLKRLDKKPRVKRVTVSKLKKEADKWFSLAIRYRDAERFGREWLVICITCGNRANIKVMQAGHFQSRRHNNTRFDEENVNGQCPRCNVWNHGEQYRYGIELDCKYGEGTAARLVLAAKRIHRFTKEELEQIIEDSKAVVSYYEKL